MTTSKILRFCVATSLPAILLAVSYASAATSYSNSLKGFTGDTNTFETNEALTAAGLTAFAPEFEPAVTFDSSGAHFGTNLPGDDGRNYMRTTQEDFATTSFTAEITFVTPDLKNQDVFFGLGTGDTALFGWPDWSTQFSSVLVLPQITDGDVSQLTTFRTQNDVNAFVDTAAPALLNGTHRAAWRSTALPRRRLLASTSITLAVLSLPTHLPRLWTSAPYTASWGTGGPTSRRGYFLAAMMASCLVICRSPSAHRRLKRATSITTDASTGLIFSRGSAVSVRPRGRRATRATPTAMATSTRMIWPSGERSSRQRRRWRPAFPSPPR